MHAMYGNAPGPHAPAGLAEPGDVRHGSDCSDASVRGAVDAASGSLSWRPLLRYAGRRLRHTLDAFLLDLRTSGSLRPGYSGIRVYVGDYPGVFPETNLRVS